MSALLASMLAARKIAIDVLRIDGLDLSDMVQLATDRGIAEGMRRAREEAAQAIQQRK